MILDNLNAMRWIFYILLFMFFYCRNHNFGDFETSTKIQRVRWHPGSTNDSHLLVLTSENSFR